MRNYLNQILDNKNRILTLCSLGGVQAASILLGLLTTALWARYTPPDTYGQYQVILSIAMIIGTLCLSGMGESLTISAAKGYDGNLIKILRYKFVALVVGGIGVACVGVYYYWNSDTAMATGLFVMALLFPLSQMDTVWISWLSGKGELNRLSAYRGIALVLSAIALAFLLLYRTTSLPVLLVGVCGVSALLTLVIIWRLTRQKSNTNEHWETIKYGFHTTAALLLGGLIAADKLIIDRYLSSSAVAVYAIAIVFPTQISTIYSIFNQMLIQKTYGADSVRTAWFNIRKPFVILVILFTSIGVIGFFLIPLFVPLLFSNKYAVAVTYAKWLWLNQALVAPSTYLANIVRSQQKIQFIYVFSIAQPLIIFMLYLLLIRYGITGIVLAKIINNWLTCLFFIVSFVYFLHEGDHVKSVS